MSLFPAYISLTSTSNDDTQTTKSPSPTPSNQTGNWLTNSSYQTVDREAATSFQSDDEADQVMDSSDGEVDDSTWALKRPPPPAAKKRSKRKRKKRRKGKQTKSKAKNNDDDDELNIEFTGQEDYYVDKKPCYRNLEAGTPKNELAKYHIKFHLLDTSAHQQWQMMSNQSKKEKSKRYYLLNLDNVSDDEVGGSGGDGGGGGDSGVCASTSCSSSKDPATATATATNKKTYRMTEDEFTAKTKMFNKRLADDSNDIDVWLEFVQFQEHFYMKMTKVQLAERKMEILNRALHDNPSNDRLYRVYIGVLEWAYPSFEVSKFLDNLIQKDPANYTLWNAQIMATQGSMARCRVPDVLALYEKCMKIMYKRNRCDEVTLRLFNSCALFIRQSGLSEQFYALLALALELNVCEGRFANIVPKDTDPNALVQFEDIVLKCGLPMNQIWLRVEKLRQNFFFLPCSVDRSCSDPQRVVLNEDIIHFIYPIANRECAFRLICIVLKLLKVPLIDSTQFKQYIFNAYDVTNNCDNLCDFDSIEDITPMFLHRTIFETNQSMEELFWRLIRDNVIGPSYITSLVGYDLYIRYISEILLQLADCYGMDPVEEPLKRKMFILLLMRLERIIMKFDTYMDKWTDDKAKRLRTKVKNLLKRDENRNCLTFYVEYASVEYDLKRHEQAERIYVAAISQSDPHADDDCTRSEYWYICISFIEMLMRKRQITKALNLLKIMAMDSRLPGYDEEFADNGVFYGDFICVAPSEATNLLTAKRLDERLKAICFIERNVTIMDMVQIFHPDYLMCVIKANIYHKMLWNKSKADAVQQMEQLLKTFPEQNQRHQYIREQLYELYADVMQYKMNAHQYGIDSMSAENAQFKMIDRALDEFPTNTYLMKCAAMCHNQPWHRVRGLFSKRASPISAVFLIIAVRYRCKQYAQIEPRNQYGQPIVDLENSWTMPTAPNTADLHKAYTVRVVNFLRKYTEHDTPTSKNSLVWRFLLRYMLEMGCSYHKFRNTVLTALNECPWNKALYLDGTVCVPQELAHIQDLIIEKQLRIYAMPEELEILRNFDGAQ